MATKTYYAILDIAVALTRSSGASNYLLIPTDDGDGSYVYQIGAGYTEDVYGKTVDDLPVGSSAISIRGYGTYKRGGPNVPSGPQPFIVLGGVKYYASSLALGTAYAEVYFDWPTNPAGGAWDAAAWNGANIGQKCYGAPLASYTRDTALRFLATYTPPADTGVLTGIALQPLMQY